MLPQKKLVTTALDEVGYIGHRSAAQLDEPAANPGGKFTKYARDLDALGDFYNGPKQGFDWCDQYVDWCFVQAFGRELAQKMTFQPDRSCGAGVGYSLGYYKSHGRFFSTPEEADQIFFGDDKSTWHTGIVSRVTGGTVCTVEGNAGSPVGVHEFCYPLSCKDIKGYGRPDWSIVPAEPEKTEAGITVYKTLDDVPSWAKSAVRKCVEKGALRGNGGGLNLSYDLCRTLVVLNRLGKLD